MRIDGLALLEAQAYQTILTCDEGSVELALKELHTVDDKATVAQEFTPGVMLINGGVNFWEVATRWSEKPPIFVRHIQPVQSVIELSEGADWQPLLAAAAGGE